MNRILSTSTLLAASVAMLVSGAAPSRAETNAAGVTAAVNPTASALEPSGKRKLISLGDPVVRNQRIETGPEGLVQILLADGTSFTVGPNSSIVIDSFVYDPEKQTASLAATMTKGALRFIGGKASKASGDVKIDTPIGTAGIRGAVVDINLDGKTADGQVIPPHVSLVFGKQVELNSRGASQRVFRPGFSIVAGDGGNSVKRTPPLWVSSLQHYLAGRPGLTGGTQTPPTDDRVRNSPVAANNSQQPPARNTIPVPQARPLPVTSPDEVAAEATRDTTRPEVDEDEGGDESASVAVLVRDSGGSLGSSGKTNATYGTVTTNSDGTTTGTYGSNSFTLPTLSSTSSLTSQTVNGTANGVAVSGTAYTGSNGFVAYMLTTGSNDPFYVIGGTPADATGTLASGEILHYVLEPDALNTGMVNVDGTTVPFTSGFASADAVSSDLLVAGVTEADGEIGRAMQASLLISGTGTGQTSAISVTAGSIELLTGGGYGLVGSTAGSGLDSGSTSAEHGQGITTTIGSTEGEDQLYGSDGEYLVVGTGSLPTVGFMEPDGEFEGYDYVHVASRDDTASSVASRTFDGKTLSGFSSWVLTDYNGTATKTGLVSMTFDADAGTFYGGISSVGGTYYADFYDEDDRTYLSDQLIAATSSTDGTYMVSSAAVPAKIFNNNTSAEICSDCEFMTWGWWGRNSYGEVDYQVHLGNWIIGDTPDNSVVPNTGTATYNGNAVGTVLTSGGSQYIATGAMSSTMDFGARTGTVEITDFDSKDFTTSVTFGSGAATFSGTGTTGTVSSSISGAFASDGSGTSVGNVKGIMGNFSASDSLDSWSSTGIFAGSTTAITPP
jgi:trimeric autotransporter adhesin